MVPLAIDKLYLLILKKNNSMIIITKHKQVYYKMTLSKWSKYFWNFTTYKETTKKIKEKIQNIHKGKKPNTNKSYQNKPKPTKLLKQNP